MKPDRSNYEIWLLDWLEGKLSDQQLEELMSFLSSNPDIREEADSIMMLKASPGKSTFKNKKDLGKSAADFSISQVEYLSLAVLEGDSTPEEEADLNDNLAINPANRQIFDSLRKIKLSAPAVSYRHKRSLKRVAPATRVIRISASLLSAAALILLLLLNHFFIPSGAVKNNREISSPVAILTIERNEPYKAMTRPGNKTMVIAVKNAEIIAVPRGPVENIAETTTTGASLPEDKGFERVAPPERLAYNNFPALAADRVEQMPVLVAAVTDSFVQSDEDDDRSSLDKFVARTFREKILKQKKAGEEPLKSYEIAEAGIEGINKLMGWDMALIKTNDEEGQLKSLYFSSKLIKFNAPVRKISDVR